MGQGARSLLSGLHPVTPCEWWGGSNVSGAPLAPDIAQRWANESSGPIAVIPLSQDWALSISGNGPKPTIRFTSFVTKVVE